MRINIREEHKEIEIYRSGKLHALIPFDKPEEAMQIVEGIICSFLESGQ